MEIRQFQSEGVGTILLGLLIIVLVPVFLPRLLISAVIDICYRPKPWKGPPVKPTTSKPRKPRHRKVRAATWM
ncbi:hypothetical protein MMA231_04123 (plasmid) [Asticcacaulis sp. MM231]